MNENRSADERVTGWVDRQGSAFVDLQVIGHAGRETVTCLIDTGFTGFLLLPQSLVSMLGLRRVSSVSAILADGSRVQLDRYLAMVDWLSSVRQMPVYAAASTEALLGTRLLSDCCLTIDYRARTVEIR